jgi:hypothetical protein
MQDYWLDEVEQELLTEIVRVQLSVATQIH